MEWAIFSDPYPSMLGGCYDIEKVKEYQQTISNPAENSWNLEWHRIQKTGRDLPPELPAMIFQ